MALVLGTNVGFCATAPVADPEGDTFTMDAVSAVCGDTSPSTAGKITEVGWYCDNATEESNFEVGLYAADGSGARAGTRLYVDATNAKGTGAGWKTVTVDWAISINTYYWIGVQLDDTATATSGNRRIGGIVSGYDTLSGQTTLADPYGGNEPSTTNGLAIYAVWEAAVAAEGGQDGPYVY